MDLKNPTRWSRVLSLCGLVLPIACQSNPTEPVRRLPEFVLVAPGTVARVSAGRTHTCALRTNGTVACWGDNAGGQATPPAGAVSQVSAGGFTCGLERDASPACWGSVAIAQTPDEPAVATRLVYAVQPRNTLPLFTIQPPVQVAAVDTAGHAVPSF